ncbi:MAG: ABC transporter permease [Mesorhizobium sp.]|nr:ABC transporter permease [Mesorhizobium sp.]MBL8580369.1 ABC transporter permease [Mesorhizobium sp.]
MSSRGERIPEILAGFLTVLVLLVLYAPVLVSALFSVVTIQRGTILWETFSLSSYATLWSNSSVLQALANTAIVAIASAAAALLFGIALAFYTRSENAIGRRSIEVLIYLPFLLPPIVTGLSLLVTTSALGVGRGLFTVIIGHTIFVLAVAYRLVSTRLAALPPSLLEASADLGASRWQTLRYVLLPHLASSIVTGAILALTLSFDETLISTFVAGDQMTLPLRLWAMMRVGFTPEINALVTLVLITSIALALLAAWRLKPSWSEADSSD